MIDQLLRPDRVIPMSLDELAQGVAGIAVPLAANLFIRDMSLDSRNIAPGGLYVGLAGQRFHGAQFAVDAVAHGAVAVLTDAAGYELAVASGVPVVVADEPRQAMARMAARLYGEPARQLSMVGITGTNGKTTSTFLVEYALAHAGCRVASVGTMGFRLGQQPLKSARTTVTTPESVDLQALLSVFRERGADSVVMEVSSHALALERVAGIEFDVAAFTNLGRDHLDFHHTLRDYFEAKATLFAPGMARSCVVNVDGPWGIELADRVRSARVQQLITTGHATQADYRVVSHRPTSRGGSVIEVDIRGETCGFEISLPGDYNVSNAVTALAICDLLGVDRDLARLGLGGAAVPGRMQQVTLRGDSPLVYVDFAHTPQAIESALSAIHVPGRIIVVFGAGGDRDDAKRGPMAVAAVRGADVVIVTDDNPRTEDPAAIRRTLLDAARAELGTSDARASVVLDGLDRRSAIATALAMATPDDAVAVLGKGHEQGQIVGDHVLEFDDVRVVEQEWCLVGREGKR